MIPSGVVGRPFFLVLPGISGQVIEGTISTLPRANLFFSALVPLPSGNVLSRSALKGCKQREPEL